MPTPKKASTIEKLHQDLTRAKSVVLTDYQGLSTTQLTDLRHRVEEVGGQYNITKNTLLKIAASQVLPLEVTQSGFLRDLRGPTATLFSFDDEVSALKALASFADEWGLPQIKGGIFTNEVISADRVTQLSHLPSRDQLRAQLVWQINAPRAGLLFTLSALTTNLVRVLDQIRKHQEESRQHEIRGPK